MAMNLKKRWADSKTIYEDTVGKRKPSKDFLSFITRSSTGVEGSLGAFDNALAAYEDDHKPATFTKLEAAGDTAKQAMKKYGQVLTDRTKKDKLTDPAYTKGLDVLVKDLDAITTLIDERIKTFKNDEKTVAKGQGKSPQEMMAIANKNLLKNWKLNSGSVLKDLAAGIAKVRAKPEPAMYQAALMAPLRDIGNVFSSGNLKQIGLDNLAQSSAYPSRAVSYLAALETATAKPATSEAVLKELDAIGSRSTVVTTWFVNVARNLV